VEIDENVRLGEIELFEECVSDHAQFVSAKTLELISVPHQMFTNGKFLPYGPKYRFAGQDDHSLLDRRTCDIVGLDKKLG